MFLVTGATGFVGGKMVQCCPDAIACPSLRDISDEALCRLIEESGADAIVHTAAISDIGVCAQHPDASYEANVRLPVRLAKVAGGRKLICFSSDQVYGGAEGDAPFREDDARPANLYAAHKLEMEERVLDIDPDAVMLRAEWMYDYYLKKPNFLMNVLNADVLRFSSKQYRGVTYVREVIDNVGAVLRLPGGAYNFGSETARSMYDITCEFLALLGRNVPLEDVPPAPNLWMDCSKAAKGGVRFSRVEDGLRRCAEDYNLIP